MLFYLPIQFSNILYHRQLMLMIHFILLQALAQVVFLMLNKEGVVSSNVDNKPGEMNMCIGIDI